MARATFLSDLKLIVDSILRRWDSSFMEELLDTEAFEAEDSTMLSRASHPEVVSSRVPITASVDQPASAEQATAS